MAGAAAACSIGGGGSTPAPTTIAGSTANPSSAVKTKSSIKLHIPASTSSSASSSRALAAVRSGRAHPDLISTASNWLRIQGYSDPSLASSYLEGPEIDLDISGNNTTASGSNSASCASDGAGGRTCTITITENVGTYYFQIATYANAPVNGTLTGQTSLDSGVTPQEILNAGSAPAPILVTLGGTINTLQLNLQQSIAETVSATLPVGVVAFDSAGEIIISSAPYSTPITFGLSVSTGLNANVYVNGTLGAQSTLPSDVITVQYSYSSAAAPGADIAIEASAGNATATADLSPLFISDSLNQSSATATSPPVIAVAINSANTSDTITFTEGNTFSGNFNFNGNYSIVPDAATNCGTTGSGAASAGQPLLFTYNGGAASTLPPAAIAASGGVASFVVTTSAFATANGPCVFDVSDGTTTKEVLSISATFTETGSGNYTANVPAGLLYLTAFQGSASTTSAAAAPGAVGTISNAGIFMVAPSPSPNASPGLYTIADPGLTEPLGIAHDTAGDVYVADYGTNSVNVYAPSLIVGYGLATPAPSSVPTPVYYSYPIPAPSGGGTIPDTPDGVAFNVKTGHLFVADNGTGTVYALALPTPAGSISQARHFGLNAARTVRATQTIHAPLERSGNGVRRFFTGPTSTTPYASFAVGGNPAGIAFDSSDRLYVTFPATGTVSQYASVDSLAGSNTIVPITNIGAGTLVTPDSIAVGPDDTIYVHDASSNTIYGFSPSNITTPTSTTSVPAGFAFGFNSSQSYLYGIGLGSNDQLQVIEGPANSSLSTIGGTQPSGPTFTPPGYFPFASF